MIAGAIAAIFVYHHVSSRPGGGPFGAALTVAPQEFDDQLRLLRTRRCAVVGVSKLVSDVRAGRTAKCEVALTFDDGYADAVTDAAPLLRRYGDVGTFYLTTGFLGQPGHIDASDVRSLARSGMEIGAHTIGHVDLTSLSDAAVEREVGISRSRLEALSSEPVRTFAYPAGRYDARVESIVRGAGFDDAVTENSGNVTPLALSRDRFALPRYRIVHGRGAALMRHVLSADQPAFSAADEAELASIARSRIAGNAPGIAERVAVALLRADFPEQVLKVRVYKAGPAVIAGVMLSGVKFHEPVDRQTFAEDAADMVYRAFAADASIGEVDIWAVVPIPVAPNATVSGDLAVPTNRTVFSASVLRTQWTHDQSRLGKTYWEPGWLQGKSA